MEYNTSELCDLFADSVDVLDPIFTSFGGRYSYGGEVTTIKCFEDKGLVDKVLATNGKGKVLLIDGGGSTRRALIDAYNAQMAAENGWEGIVCYGSALTAIPVNSESKEIGDLDIAVNFAGVTFLPEDHLYADGTGIILSPEALDID
jgi:regulator of ribonuclease activity A